jgi:hypothetical protein
VAGFIDYMGSSGQFGLVQKQPTPASERGYSFPNQDPNFGQQPAGRPVGFMLHGMLGFQSSGQARGPGGNTSGHSNNLDPEASISMTGQAPHNSNNHNGHPDRIEFGRNPYKLEGILCQTWAWKLFDVPCPFMAWHTAKMFSAKSLSKSDKHIVFRSESWLAAMHNLKQVHAPDDDNSVDAIAEKMMTARLAERESASSLINR